MNMNAAFAAKFSSNQCSSLPVYTSFVEAVWAIGFKENNKIVHLAGKMLQLSASRFKQKIL